MKKMIAWGFNKTGQAITLNLSATIFASRSSIDHRCRQTFGISPRALLKQFRLAHVQQSPGFSRSSAHHRRPYRARDCLPLRLSKLQSLCAGLPQPIRRIPQRNTSTGIRSWDEHPVGLRGPEPPNGHGSEVVASPVGLHRGNRLRRTELQTTGIHLFDDG